MLVAQLAIVAAVAALGSISTIQNVDGWYADAAKAAWNPPPWSFGPVWSVLYTLMAVAMWLVWRRRKERDIRRPAALYVAQLVLNALWTPGVLRPLPGDRNGGAVDPLVIIVALDVLVAMTLVRVPTGGKGSRRGSCSPVWRGCCSRPASIWRSPCSTSAGLATARCRRAEHLLDFSGLVGVGVQADRRLRVLPRAARGRGHAHDRWSALARASSQPKVAASIVTPRSAAQRSKCSITSHGAFSTTWRALAA